MKAILFLAIVASATTLISDPSCMDNSQHGNTCNGFDYKKYYYVGNCTCPCWKHAHSFKRNHCEQCDHFNVFQLNINQCDSE